MYICQSQSPNSSHHHPPATFPPWCPYLCSLLLCLYFCPANRFICTIFLGLIGILNVKSHSRKEGRFVRSNKKDKCSGLQSPFIPSEALDLYFIRQEDFAQILCTKIWLTTEKCQFKCNSFKDESNDSCNRKMTGLPGQEHTCLCQGGHSTLNLDTPIMLFLGLRKLSHIPKHVANTPGQ